ncbi:MAG: hypothetical protein RIM72_14425 [Alphaproteobacteria bacterium]
MRIWRSAVLVVAVALAGCSAADLPFSSGAAQKEPASPTAVKTIKTGTTDPLPPASLLSDDPSNQQASAGLTPLPEIEVNDDPDQFLHGDGLDVNAALGAPGFIRRDGPAEVWQYTGRKDGATCILDVYLYSDASTADALRVTFVELRGASATRAQRRACFADMLRRQIRAKAG